jgi:hypothetical protein
MQRWEEIVQVIAHTIEIVQVLYTLLHQHCICTLYTHTHIHTHYTIQFCTAAGLDLVFGLNMQDGGKDTG